jgi:hypothetical protein
MSHTELWFDLHRVDVWELLAPPHGWHSSFTMKASLKFSMKDSAVAARAQTKRVGKTHRVYPVSLVQPNKPDRPNRPNEQGWLEKIADQLHRLFRRGRSMDKMRREIFEQAHPGLVGPQQNHGLLCLER